MVVFADKSREAELIEIWKQSFGDSEENSGCQGFRGERMLSIAEQRGFLGQ